MTTLELLQLQNEHKENNFYEKGEDFLVSELNKISERQESGDGDYEYDGTAIYDLHISSSLTYIWKTHMFVGGGVIRGMTVSDIEKFFYENPDFAAPGYLNIVQDINHMSDIYLIP